MTCCRHAYRNCTLLMGFEVCLAGSVNTGRHTTRVQSGLYTHTLIQTATIECVSALNHAGCIPLCVQPTQLHPDICLHKGLPPRQYCQDAAIRLWNSAHDESLGIRSHQLECQR